ncbi:MAG: TatD family hydrolase [Acidobacteriota bacterium]|nr:TatD family hydrolase [Acidobacteriota bacterium]
MTSWTDAHCHLQDRFAREGETASSADTLARALAAGVDRVVVVGTDATSSREALALTELSGDVQIYATVGLHPHDALHDVEEIVELARRGHPRLVGVGECGLDYYYEHSPREAQRRAFARQIQLAHELDLALVVHCRDAFDDAFDVFDSEGVPARTVIHCFTGTPEEASVCLERGCDISISGVVTFKNAQGVRDAARLVPLDRLHVETDSPFLAPVPHRGAPNEPAWVSVVGEFLAELRGEDVEVLRRATSENTARLFKFLHP